MAQTSSLHRFGLANPGSSHATAGARLSHLTRHFHKSPSLTMSSEAPWRATFLSHISHLKPPTFTLASLHHTPSSSSSPSSSAYHQARARTCVLRGLFGSLPPNPRNPAPLNPPIIQSDLLTFTTDARMSKYSDFSSPQGGPVEAVFWVEEPAKTQWRIRGTAYVLSSETYPVLEHRLRRVKGAEEEKDEEKEEWSWQKEVTAHFGNLSPVMRGSFKGPAPGQPKANGDGGLKLGEKVENDELDDETARKNFRVVVIVPEEVDQVLLDEVPGRWLYVYRGLQGKAEHPGGELMGEWERVELWP